MAIELYHCAPLPLSPGSVICPGNWGRIKRRFEQNALSLLRESILDDIRRRKFSHKPSRLDAAFGCPTLVDAEQYRSRHASTGVIYRVELVDPGAPSHQGDHELYLQGFTGIDGMEDLARRYWKGESLGGPELLTLSPLRILECVNTTCANLTGLKS
jgi:hypothetical protein